MATSIIWPSTLPQYVLSDNYSRAPVDNTIESEVDSGGYVEKRRRFSAEVDIVSVSYQMTLTQKGYFNTFFRSTLYSGTLRFNWPDPEIGGTTREVQIVKDSVKSTPAGGIYLTVSFQLRVYL
jgi:hypothetical protein